MWTNKDVEKERTALFVKLMKYAIGMVLIMDIALDPLALALSDPEVDSHIPFDAMTEPIPMMMPSIVRIDLILLPRIPDNARLTFSQISISSPPCYLHL